MFIVKKGLLSVVDDTSHNVVETLMDGSTFGELSVIHVPGNILGDRRAVSLRSVGYSDVYILAQDDVTGILSEYPAMRDTLYKKAREMLKNKELLEETDEVDEDPLTQMITLSIDEQLQLLAENIKIVDDQLNHVFDSFQDLSTKMKKRVTRLESVYKSNHRKIRKDCLRGLL